METKARDLDRRIVRPQPFPLDEAALALLRRVDCSIVLEWLDGNSGSGRLADYFAVRRATSGGREAFRTTGIACWLHRCGCFLHRRNAARLRARWRARRAMFRAAFEAWRAT